MKLICEAALLGPIIDELLNILHTKLARVMSFPILHTMRAWFCSGFYPTRVVKDKAWATSICYLVVDHAHPTLEFSLVGGRINGGAYRLDGPPTLPWQVSGHPITISLTIDVRYMREAHTTRRPFLSRITGLAPSSLPVIFSRMVVFPAFRRPMISTRNRSHIWLSSSDERSMLVSTKQRSRKWR